MRFPQSCFFPVIESISIRDYTDRPDLIIGKLMQPASIMVQDAVQALFLLIIVCYERCLAKTDHASVSHFPCTRNLILNDRITLVNFKTASSDFFL